MAESRSLAAYRLFGCFFDCSRSLHVVRAVPFEGAPQAFFKKHGWLITEILFGPANIGARIANISLSRRIMFWFDFLAGHAPQEFDYFIQRNREAGSNVVHLAGRAGSLKRQQVGLHRILHKREVSCLFAVAVNYRM